MKPASGGMKRLSVVSMNGHRGAGAGHPHQGSARPQAPVLQSPGSMCSLFLAKTGLTAAPQHQEEAEGAF